MRAHTRPLGPVFLIACLLGGATCSPTAELPPEGSGGSGGRGGSAAGGAGSGGGSTGGRGGSTGGGAGSGGSTAGSGATTADSGGSPARPDGSTGNRDAPRKADAGSSSADGNPATGGAFPPGPHKVYILHDANAGGSANDPSRKSMVDALDAMRGSHGITAVELRNSPTPAAQMMDASLIIVGPNASMFGDNHPAADLQTTAIPIIVSKDGNTGEIGLGRVAATDSRFNRITIVKTDHPLAAGFPMGSLEVLTTTSAQRIIAFTGVGPGAIKIANSPENPGDSSLIAYEKGADMGNGLRAPAKRVGLFWHRPAGVTDAGKKLFQAAVEWAIRP